MSAPVSDLKAMLATMSPVLNPQQVAFVTTRDPASLHARIPAEAIIGTFRETEGTTFIVEQQAAETAGCEIAYRAAWITLTVHSDLAAVGLTAAFATALGSAGISANVMAAVFHDHIFVALTDADRALAALQQLQRDSVNGA